MARPIKNKKDSKAGSRDRTSWKKPDGTPLRKRRGDYFPDQEIEKRSSPKRRFESESGSNERPPRDAFEGRKTDDRGFKKRSDKPFGKSSPSKERSSNRPEKSWTKQRKDEFKPYGSSHKENTDETKKPYKKDDFEKPSGEKKPWGKNRSEKPSWKKRERYDRIEHSGNMGNRFEKPRRSSKSQEFSKQDRKPTKKSFNPDSDGAIRLNRYIANAGICSRREADDLISAGVISINGEVVTELGTKVTPGDEVRFHDRVLRTERMVYVLLNKPKDYITTTDDPDDRKTVMNLVHDACKERIFPVGRLDRNTTGLLLLTNDGELTRKLTHPSSNIAKVYQVELDKNLTLADMKQASDGVELDDGEVRFDNIEYASPDDKKIVGVELHSGKNRIVRRIFEALGYDVKKLDRTVFAGLTKKDLPRGRWRFLTELEVNALKMMKGGTGRSKKRQ